MGERAGMSSINPSPLSDLKLELKLKLTKGESRAPFPEWSDGIGEFPLYFLPHKPFQNHLFEE